MVELSIDGDTLVGEIEGWHQVWAVKSTLRVPLEHIVSVEARPEMAKSWWHGWKIMGTDVPGEFAAGLFRTGGKWVFWDVRNPDNAISIKLTDDKYNEMILEVEDPDAAVELINRVVGLNES